MRWQQIIVEDRQLARVIAAAKQANASLSPVAQDAIERWESVNWPTGTLARAFSAKADAKLQTLRAEIETIFAPVRAILRAEYGATIRLYRGQRAVKPEEADPNRVLFSWTSDPKIARMFGPGPSKREITDDEIAQALAQYEKTGYASLRSYRYLRSREDPAYFMIYRGREAITDGDDLEQELRDRQEAIRDFNHRQQAAARMVADDVPIDAIVWITNRLNCKEFICRWNVK